MGVASSISRFTAYLKRHGFGATIRRAGAALKQSLFASRTVLFYCDLAKQTKDPASIPSPLRVERLTSLAELGPKDLHEMTSFWDEKQANRNIRERFGRGASLWLLRSEENLAGFGWTLQGSTVEPHYFPLTQDDVHLFDFHVFPEYRGHGLNPLLVSQILGRLAAECGGRAFIEAGEWNEAQLASLRKTAFRRIGSATKSTVFRRTIVFWDQTEAGQQAQRDVEGRNEAARVVTSREK
jgi:ribosomal protein S18 acetylase RimI-like enzyme